MRPQQTTPTSLPSQVFYPYTSKKSGKTYEVPWNKPDPPSQDDFDFLEKQILADEDKEDKPVKIETKVEEPTFLSRVKEATPKNPNDPVGLPVGGGGITTDPNESLLTSIPKRLFRELDSYMGGFGEHVIKTGIEAIKDIPDIAKAPLGAQGLLSQRAGIKNLVNLLGGNYANLESDVLNKRAGAATADVAVPAAMIAGMHYGGKLGGVETRGINPADMPFDTVVRTVPDAEPPRLNAAPPPIPPTPKQLPGIGESTPTRLPGTPPTVFNRYPDVPTPPRFASHPSGAVGDLTNISTPEGLSSLNIIRPPEGTTPPVVGNPFKKNALPPIEELPIVDTSIIEQRKPPIQPQPNIIPQVEPPAVQQPSIVPQPIRPPEMGMVPTPPRVEPPLQQSPIVSKFKPDIGTVAEGEPRPVGSGSTIPRKQGLFNRLFGDATGTFDPEAMGKEIERLKQQFLEKRQSKQREYAEPLPPVTPIGLGEETGKLAKFENENPRQWQIAERLSREFANRPRDEKTSSIIARLVNQAKDNINTHHTVDMAQLDVDEFNRAAENAKTVDESEVFKHLSRVAANRVYDLKQGLKVEPSERFKADKDKIMNQLFGEHIPNVELPDPFLLENMSLKELEAAQPSTPKETDIINKEIARRKSILSKPAPSDIDMSMAEGAARGEMEGYQPSGEFARTMDNIARRTKSLPPVEPVKPKGKVVQFNDPNKYTDEEQRMLSDMGIEGADKEAHDISTATNPDYLFDKMGYWNDRYGEAIKANDNESLEHADKMGRLATKRYGEITGQELPDLTHTRPLEDDGVASDVERMKERFLKDKAKRDEPSFERRDEPSFAKVKGGGLVVDTDNSRAVTNLTKDYTGALEGVMGREGIQNMKDAIELMGDKGVMRIRLGYGAEKGSSLGKDRHNIELHDNGPGMDEDTLAEKLVRLFATGKKDATGASGGKGIGSASYLFGGEHSTVDTVAIDRHDGKKYRIIASGIPEQWYDPVKGSDYERYEVPMSTPTGTRVKTILKETQNQYHTRNMVNNIINHSRNLPGKLLFDDSDYSKGIPIDKMNENPNGGNIIDEHTFKDNSQDKLIGDFTIKNNEIKVYIPPFDEAKKRTYYEVHYLNNGMYQFSDSVSVAGGKPIKGIPEDVLVDTHPLVDEEHGDYPFINTREDMKKDLRKTIDEFIEKNVSGPAVNRTKNRTQELYDSMPVVKIPGVKTNRKVVIFDPGERLTKAEMDSLVNNPTVGALVKHWDTHISDILDAVGNKEWKDRLEAIGLVFEPGANGVHIPNPDTGKSTIVFSPFPRIQTYTPEDAAFKATITGLHEVGHIGDESGEPVKFPQQYFNHPRLEQWMNSYFDQMIAHSDVGWENTGHKIDFIHRLGKIYAAYGPERTFRDADRLQRIYTGGRVSGYSPEVQKLLQLYTEREGRPETTEDLLSGTGVKQANKGRTGKGILPSNDKPNGEGITPEFKSTEPRGTIEPVDWTKAGEVPVNPEDYGQVPKVIKLGKGLSKLKPESSNKLEYEDLPSAPVKPKRESTLKPGELNTSRFGGGKEPPKEPPNKLVPEPEPPEEPRNIPPERIDPVYQDREFLKGKSDIKGESQEAAIRARKEREADIQKQKEKRADKYAKEEEERNKPKTVEDIIADKKKKNPGIDDATFTKAVKALPKRFRNNALYKAVYEPLGVSGLTKLKRMGESGIKLAKMIRDERTESNRFGGEMAQAVREARRNLSKAEQTEVVKILDGQKPLREASSQAVKDAYKALRATTEKLGNEAIKAGVRMKDSSGDIVPFDKLSGEYFPHRYPEELFKDPKSLREKLLKAGNSPAAVDAMMDRVTKKGERFSSAQHARDFDLPGYHETLDALEAHQYEMARVITRAKRFGPGDVSDAESPISKLIAKSDSPTKAQEIVNRYLNRKESNTETEAQQKIANIIVNAEVGTKLSQFMVSNVVGDLNTSTMTLGIKNTANALTKTLTDPHGSADIATRSGALSAIRNELTNDVTAHKLLGKAYGTMTSEKLVRTVEALAGRAEVNRLFELAKKDKKHVNALSEFVDGDVNSVLKQDKLTDEQLDFASGRAAEMTSGIPDATTLSKTLNAKNPLIRLLTLFKRFSFLNVKNLSDAVGRVPESNLGYKKAAKIAAILVGYQVAGETIGDIKALIKGLASGDIKGDIEKRGDYVGFKNKTLDRVMANYLQSALFGLVGDAAESIASRPYRSKFSGTALGPAGSDLDEMLDVGSDLMTPSKPGVLGGKPAGKSRFNSLGKAIVKRVPYIGAGLQERWDKEKNNLKGLPLGK